MKENEFAKKLTKGFRDCNGLVLSVVGNRMQMSAWPDIYVAHRYWTGWIEFKGEKTVLRKDQKIMIERLKEKGAYAFVVRCPNKIEDENGNLLGIFDLKHPSALLLSLMRLSCPPTQ